MVTASPPGLTAARGLAETREILASEARKRFGPLPATLLADHVLAVTEGADFAVREAALSALQRRWGFGVRDGLVVATRPSGGRAFGLYTTARQGQEPVKRSGAGRRAARPYSVLLEGIDPIAGSCDCADFLTSGLGLCKHLLVVLSDVFGSPRRAAAAAREGRVERAGPRLVWDPRLALSGPLDRLAGLRLEPGVEAPARGGASLASLARLRAAFPGGALDRRRVATADSRLELLTLLESVIRPARGGRPLLDSSPSARALVREERTRTERGVRCASESSARRGALGGLKRKLYPYQREGVARFLSSGRLLLADDMGLGKTTQAIAACHALYAAGAAKRGLVVVPASLKPQWLREWQETTDTPIAAVDGAPAARARQYRQLRSGFLLIGYEQLLRDFEPVRALEPDLVVLDEAQRIKNYATKTAAYVKALSPEYRLVLTGTPMENRLEELASILDWVDPVALAPKWRLVPWYTAWDGDGSASGKAGARNLDTLRQRLAPCVLRRVRREVLAQLPPRADTRVPVVMTPQQLDAHDELREPIKALISRSKGRPLTQPEFLRLMSLLTQQRIISNGLAQLRFEELWPAYASARPDDALLEGLFAPKLLELRRLLADLVVAQERKVVIFSQWRRMLRLAEWSVREVLGDAGLSAVFFTGAEKPAQRTKSIADFHDDPRVRVMFLSDAGGVGLNLQRAASACVNLELPWNPAVLEQRIGRIYRLGQKHPIDVYNLVSEEGIESRIASLVGVKQQLFKGLFDGTTDELRFDGAASFLTRVERLVDLGSPPEPPAASAPPPPGAEPEEDGEGAAASSGSAEAAIADELPAEPPEPPARDGRGRAPRASDVAAAAPAPVTPETTAGLFAALRVERTPGGGVRIEAPPEAARSLVALFEGMAKLVGAAAGSPERPSGGCPTPAGGA